MNNAKKEKKNSIIAHWVLTDSAPQRLNCLNTQLVHTSNGRFYLYICIGVNVNFKSYAHFSFYYDDNLPFFNINQVNVSIRYKLRTHTYGVLFTNYTINTYVYTHCFGLLTSLVFWEKIKCIILSYYPRTFQFHIKYLFVN